jgi:hypothetical protein
VEAVIFIGPQGAGKTTFYERHFPQTHVRISLDVLGTRNRERQCLEACLASGRSFVIDNTNPRASERKHYIDAARAAGFRVAGYWFRADLRTALARNAQRPGKAKIPVPGVIGTFKRIEPPSLSEGFDELYEVAADGAVANIGRMEGSAEMGGNWNDEEMITGLTPGFYANRTGEYEVRVDGTIWLIGGVDLNNGGEPRRVYALPGDAAMTKAATLEAPSSGGTTPPGRGPDPEQAHYRWGKEKA